MHLTTDRKLAVRLCAVALAMVAPTLLCSGAMAASPDDTHLTQKVSFADLNLSQPAGLASLYGRVRRAAQNVCAPMASRDLALQAKWNACVADATTRAVANIDVPAFSTYYNARVQHTGTALVASN